LLVTSGSDLVFQKSLLIPTMERDNRTWTLLQSHISDTNQSMEKE